METVRRGVFVLGYNHPKRMDMDDFSGRYFDPDPQVKKLAIELYEGANQLPLLCPHGHVDAAIFFDPNYHFPNPAQLLIIPDHYLFRMLHSQGIALEKLGVPRRDWSEFETDPRRIWQLFAENLYLFRGTPSSLWLTDELRDVFRIKEKLTGENVQKIYDPIQECLASPEFQPCRLYERFNIEALCTTDPATSRLEDHAKIRTSGWNERILPTFRPDAVLDIRRSEWLENVQELAQVCGIDIHDFRSFLHALEIQRAAFKSMGAIATDHDCINADTLRFSALEADAIFQRALKSKADAGDSGRFMAGMLFELARMSSEDGRLCNCTLARTATMMLRLLNALAEIKARIFPCRWSSPGRSNLCWTPLVISPT
jgi:glucuronate isomerase